MIQGDVGNLFIQLHEKPKDRKDLALFSKS